MTTGTFLNHILPLGSKNNDFGTISISILTHSHRNTSTNRCFSSRESVAQYRPSQTVSSKNWREFRPCQRVFYRCTGRTVLSRTQKLLQKSARVSSLQLSAFLQCIGRAVHSGQKSHRRFVYRATACVFGYFPSLPLEAV